MSAEGIKVLVNLIAFLIALIFSFVFILKIKLGSKSFKLLFITYTLFWIPLMLLRENTATFELRSLGDHIYLWLPLSAYGFIGIFARPLADYIAYKRCSHKTFIYVALIIQLVTFIPIIIYPCTTTNVIQSLGVGLGASCIGTYQLLFNEQYDVKSHQFLTISILSIPPLLADLLSSPITSLIRSAAERWSTQYDKDILKYAWVIGLSIVVITFILTFFIKEDKSLVFKDNIFKQQIKTKNEWIYFYMLAVLGFLIAFVKFSNSGSIAVTHVQELAKLLNYPSSGSYEGYISLLFSISQLAGGLITGMVLIKRFSKLFIFCLGSGIWIIYEILCLFVYNPYAYLGVHMLNGFAYGILYNLILGFVLMRCFKTNKITPMGIYQMILSIGITLSTWFVPWIKYVMHEEDADWMHYKSIIMVINGVVIGVIMLSVLIFYYCHYLENKIKIENKPKSVDINKKMIS